MDQLERLVIPLSDRSSTVVRRPSNAIVLSSIDCRIRPVSRRQLRGAAPRLGTIAPQEEDATLRSCELLNYLTNCRMFARITVSCPALQLTAE
jgi:hypothetical protein